MATPARPNETSQVVQFPDDEGWELVEAPPVGTQPGHGGNAAGRSQFELNLRVALGSSRGDSDYANNRREHGFGTHPRHRGAHQRHSQELQQGDYDSESISTFRLPASCDEDAQLQSRLFSLPAELRISIYTLVLRVDMDNSDNDGDSNESDGSDRPPVHLVRGKSTPSVLAILSTCQRVLREAETIFYTINCLSVNGAEARNFLSTLGQRRRETITTIVVRAKNSSEGLSGVSALAGEGRDDGYGNIAAGAPNLERLTLRRFHDIRYTETGSWRILRINFDRELQQLQRLCELKIIMPAAPARSMSSQDEGRVAQLADCDGWLRDEVARRAWERLHGHAQP